MQQLHINFTVPKDWHELTDKQLRFVYHLIATDHSADEIKTLALLHWSGARVVGRQRKGVYLLQKGKHLFEADIATVAELCRNLSWLDTLPTVPVRISRLHRHKALPADFQGVPFEIYIVVDNLYQGFLQTQDDAMLDELATQLYGKRMKLTPAERINIFYWLASLKDFFAKRYKYFFQPLATSDSNLLGSAANIGTQLLEAMDAQIRALTKGDPTKEAEILQLDTWRALTELNAQAREYQEMQKQLKK